MGADESKEERTVVEGFGFTKKETIRSFEASLYYNFDLIVDHYFVPPCGLEDAFAWVVELNHRWYGISSFKIHRDSKIAYKLRLDFTRPLNDIEPDFRRIALRREREETIRKQREAEEIRIQAPLLSFPEGTLQDLVLNLRDGSIRPRRRQLDVDYYEK